MPVLLWFQATFSLIKVKKTGSKGLKNQQAREGEISGYPVFISTWLEFQVLNTR